MLTLRKHFINQNWTQIKGIAQEWFCQFTNPHVVPNMYDYLSVWNIKCDIWRMLVTKPFWTSTVWTGLCSWDEKNVVQVRTTWEWVNDDKISIFGWNIPLNMSSSQPNVSKICGNNKINRYVINFNSRCKRENQTSAAISHSPFILVRYRGALWDLCHSRSQTEGNLLCLMWKVKGHYRQKGQGALMRIFFFQISGWFYIFFIKSSAENFSTVLNTLPICRGIYQSLF